MRRRPWIWLCVSLLCFLAAAYLWQLGDEWAARKAAPPTPSPAEADPHAPLSAGSQEHSTTAPRVAGPAGALNTPPGSVLLPTNGNAFLNYRLSNTGKTVGQLARSRTAILLENALFDTALSTPLQIPAFLRAQTDPGTYIVQSRGPLDDSFRARLRSAGVSIISYVPNNAYLVRGSAEMAQQLQADPGTQAVLPYEPYFKLKATLLKVAVEQTPLPPDTTLNVAVFADARDTSQEELRQLGAQILVEDRSPFGPVFQVKAPPGSLTAIVGLAGVKAVEQASARRLANDLSRPALQVAADSVTDTNYFELTGTNVLVAMSDSGVDANHPDLQGRVFLDVPGAGVDTDGHGTHSAGIIAGSGAESSTVTNASGSVNPGTGKQYRGKAPGASLFSMQSSRSDFYLQEMAARTNASILNSGWTYGSGGYDLAAASYDAAVRDALPEVPGTQPLLLVFPAGNAGTGGDQPLTGVAGTILSPGTSKNGITVGAMEQLRKIDAQVSKCMPDSSSTNGMSCTTNQPWVSETDSGNQVAAFSSRGNVGILIEGDYGRFKPDVVAPGTFVVSTRSTQWDQEAYYNPTNYHSSTFTDQVDTNYLANYSLFIPANAVAASITVAGPLDMPIYLKLGDNPTTNDYDFLGTNRVSFPGDLPLNSPAFWFYSIADPSNQPISFSVTTRLVTTNDLGDYFQVLSNLNDSIGTSNYYRYETGSSMAAAAVSGTLALMQEFFEQRLQRTNSPALMKALLINGARSVNTVYDVSPTNVINYQGWGMVNLAASLPPALSNLSSGGPLTMQIFDQDPTNALATGQSCTRGVSLSDDATNETLRITLVWTDPPADPAVGIKLVNNLDLIVTNLDTGEVFFGNDIAIGNNFNSSWNTNETPHQDVVNNVENVFLPPPLGSNYTVTVVARNVNVNAVSANTDNVVQDYALVMSLGSGALTNALTVTNATPVSTPTWTITLLTNQFSATPTYTGQLLMNQHVGANAPLQGTNTIPLPTDANAVITAGVTSQWHFYVISNDQQFTNAAFLTFMPQNLSVPRMGTTNEASPGLATRPEADIDIYVSPNPALTNLDPAVLASADKSVGRGGTEYVLKSDVGPVSEYYIGIKSEDQQSAEYGFLGIFSLLPFGSEDENGNMIMPAVAVPTAIPDGTPANPGMVRIFSFCPKPLQVRRVVVTENLSHQNFGDLYGDLTHGSQHAVLNNHKFPPINPPPYTYQFVFEDNGEGDIPGAQPTDGPGSLQDFIGEAGVGPWTLTMVDNAYGHTGMVDSLSIRLEPETVGPGGAIVTLQPGAFRLDSIDVPADATNLTVCVFGNIGPLDLFIRRGTAPTTNLFDYFKLINPPGACLSITPWDQPPLIPGRYYIGVFNPTLVVQQVHITATVLRNPYAIASSIASASGLVPIQEDAITYAYVTNLTHLPISSVDIGLRIRHPRISDLAVTLISPNGTRILLMENRGAASTNGLGSFLVSPGGPPSLMIPFYTNDFDALLTGPYSPGATPGDWNVLTNYVVVYPEMPAPWISNNVLVLADGIVSNTLPTTNSTSYTLTYEATHAPYLVGTVGWWPLDGSGDDIFGGFNGQLFGDVLFKPGEVGQAFVGDGIATRMMVPRAPALDVGQGAGFTIEGWINPAPPNTNSAAAAVVFANDFENLIGGTTHTTFTAPGHVCGWHVDSGSVVLLGTGWRSGYAYSGANYLDSNGSGPGRISTNISVTAGKRYVVSLAFARNPDATTSRMAGVYLSGQPLLTLTPSATNTWASMRWQTTSAVFTASSPTVSLQLGGLSAGSAGVLFDDIVVQEVLTNSYPVVEWNDASSAAQGVQFGIWGTVGSNYGPFAIQANIWDANSRPHFFTTVTNAITNGGWQHVALTFTTLSNTAVLYTNGHRAAVTSFSSLFTPRTSGDLYFGYHPAVSTNVAAFAGGLDEFGLYERALSDCEVAAIFRAGSGGKYSPSVLTCPVVSTVQLSNSTGASIVTFTNGLAWTNAPQWETNTISFTGSITDLTSLVIIPGDSNVAIDNLVLAGLRTNLISGDLHFDENTNLALVPIKFAPTPYAISNFPPILVFSNEFESALSGIYATNATIPGTPNDPAFGPRNWTVINGSVTVVSNSFLDALGSNFVAMAAGGLQCTLPTIPGTHYRLGYLVRGPAAVSWWNGDVEPLSQRAWDLLAGNNGAFINSASTTTAGLVNALGDTAALSLPGWMDASNASKIDLGDPPGLRFTNSFTIEGWINPAERDTFLPGATEQILFRGDSRDCLDPYWLALQRVSPTQLGVLFHIENSSGHCGVTLATTDQPITNGGWQHLAAVFEANVGWTNNPPYPTNELRLYLNGVLLTNVLLLDPVHGPVASSYTSEAPFQDLDPAFSPGVAIGNRSRAENSQPYYGLIDELSIYGRALTVSELAAIAAAGSAGKADFRVPPAQGLGEVSLSLNDVQVSVGHGDNSRWTAQTYEFSATDTNMVMTLQSQLPGTLLDGITLMEIPAELYYLPEDSLATLNGEDAFGVWKLEIWDTRTGVASTNDADSAALLNWQLNLVLLPSNAPPVISLAHGIPYTNSLVAHGVQNFIVDVPQWAGYATNILLSAYSRALLTPLPVGVLWDATNPAPASAANAIVWPPASFGTNLLTTNGLPPFIVPGQRYYLTITNPNPVAVTFAFGVWFDVTPLPNCVPVAGAVSQAGVPHYFQFDVPPIPGAQVQAVSLYLTGVPGSPVGLRSNVTVVLSQHLPLPGLAHFDYISSQPDTNDNVIMVVTNSTPFPVQTNRWYVGVFSQAGAPVPFSITACCSTAYPTIIPLTNGVPFVGSITNSLFAPPGPPQTVFFEFDITNSATWGVLFELYNLSGDADLVLQREVLPTMAPYFAGSFSVGRSPEQIVLRPTAELGDLRGHWYLGVYNNDAINVTYTLRAVVQTNGMLASAQPFQTSLMPLAQGQLLQWNSVVGEYYVVEANNSLKQSGWTLVVPAIQATTVLTTCQVSGTSLFYRVRQVPWTAVPGAPLAIQRWSGHQVRISWPTSFTGQILQYATNLNGPWANVSLTVTTEGSQFVVYDFIGPDTKFYRLIP